MEQKVRLVLFNPKNKIKRHKEVTENLTFYPCEQLLKGRLENLKALVDRKINCGRVSFAETTIRNHLKVNNWACYWTEYPWILREEDNPELVIAYLGTDMWRYETRRCNMYWEYWHCWLIGLK